MELSKRKSKISENGEILIPKELMDVYRLDPNGEILIVPVEDGILIKHPETPLRGIFKGKLDTTDIENEIRRVRESWTLQH